VVDRQPLVRKVVEVGDKGVVVVVVVVEEEEEEEVVVVEEEVVVVVEEEEEVVVEVEGYTVVHKEQPSLEEGLVTEHGNQEHG